MTSDALPNGSLPICVYCSSSSAVDEAYKEAARTLGQLIAAQGHSLVFGGGKIGLMGELARAVRGGGARVVGVIPRRLQAQGLDTSDLDELHVTETMAERKGLMIANARAFVALPGGFGTLEEVIEVITLKQLGYLDAPIVMLNTAGFYQDLLTHFERLYREQFAKPIYRQLYYVAATPQDVLDHIEGYRPTEMPPKWY